MRQRKATPGMLPTSVRSCFSLRRSASSMLRRALMSVKKPTNSTSPGMATRPTARRMGTREPSLCRASTSRPCPMMLERPVLRWVAR